MKMKNQYIIKGFLFVAIMTLMQSCFVAKDYEAPKVTYVATAYSGSVSGMSEAKVNLGVSLIRPVSGVITTRFGRSSSGHRGLDIATSTGTPIKAAAGGKVTVAGWNNSYGYMIKVSHGNGVETVYAHCSKLLVSKGQTVSQGQVIAKIGSTGYSTGPHLHFEVRVNGTLYNPQNYVY